MTARVDPAALPGRFVPLRAADLEDRVQALGRGLRPSHRALSPEPIPLEPALLVEALQSWVTGN